MIGTDRENHIVNLVNHNKTSSCQRIFVQTMLFLLEERYNEKMKQKNELILLTKYNKITYIQIQLNL